MNETDYNNLDIYDKLKLMVYICYKVSKGLKNVGDVYEARNYIDGLMVELIEHFNKFSKDKEFITEENFGKQSDLICRNIGNVMELAPLIQSGEADFKYLISILDLLGEIAEESLPDNVKLARIFHRLLEHKTELAEQLGINEEEFAHMIGKMVDDVDSVNRILTSDNEKKRESR